MFRTRTWPEPPPTAQTLPLLSSGLFQRVRVAQATQVRGLDSLLGWLLTAGSQHTRCHSKLFACAAGCLRNGIPPRFGTGRDLNRHYELVHKQVRQQCPHCPKSIKRRDNLQRHIQALHKDKTSL